MMYIGGTLPKGKNIQTYFCISPNLYYLCYPKEFIMKNVANNIFKIGTSLILGGAILYWMYRDFDFKSIEHVLMHEMDWTWMILSFPFGILAQMFRGWRWRQTLEPIGEYPRNNTSINSIFLSYALSLVIPRSGEFARCGVS